MWSLRDPAHRTAGPGTVRPPEPTVNTVKCQRYREAASARLDGQPLGLSATALEHHLASCVDCARWLETATRVGRSLRVTGLESPDLSAQILADVVLPAARVGRYRRGLRAALALLGFIQWALALPALFGDSVGMAMSMHASHESAAWNLALGAAFIAVAVKPVRAIGTLPILATFVAVLSVLSVPDLAAGTVPPERLASHTGVLVGLVLVALMSRSHRLTPPAGQLWQSGQEPSESPGGWDAAGGSSVGAA
jgi:predicted anti-sigma-YlaC factor YlaD